jgi:hypothetical protein
MSVPANGAALTLVRKPEQKGKIPLGPHPRSNNMKQHIPEEFSTRLRSPFAIMGNTVPPRDPDEDEEDEEDEEEEDNADEPPVVREPDED